MQTYPLYFESINQIEIFLVIRPLFYQNRIVFNPQECNTLSPNFFPYFGQIRAEPIKNLSKIFSVRKIWT